MAVGGGGGQWVVLFGGCGGWWAMVVGVGARGCVWVLVCACAWVCACDFPH